MSPGHDVETLVSQWLSEVQNSGYNSLLDDPGYYMNKPRELVTSSSPQKFILGTGEQVLASILEALQLAKHEILFVTCFWAKSSSQDALSSTLRALSSKAIAKGYRIRVRIGFSSCSVWQKLTQTSSLSGREYAPSLWSRKFGLPDPSELRGLDLTLRSIFVRPFSVMHSKFIIVDRKTLFMPSCNVSWEDWFEGCIEVHGDVVQQALNFWGNFWGRYEPLPPLESGAHIDARQVEASPLRDLEMGLIGPGTTLLAPFSQSSVLHPQPVRTIFLPSPHHRNPRFHPFSPVPPTPASTPLNLFLLRIINEAKHTIYIQSPNITSYPVIAHLQSALQRGVNIKIVSNTRMMVVEQLVTAGTLTEWELKKMYAAWLKQNGLSLLHDPHTTNSCRTQGNLEISYYDPRGEVPTNEARRPPLKSHLKLTIVDNEIVVLGSGNMDRASWYTSQELGIAFFSKDLAKDVMHDVREGLEGRLRNITDKI